MKFYFGIVWSLAFLIAAPATAEIEHSYVLIQLPGTKTNVRWASSSPRLLITYKLVSQSRTFSNGYNCPQLESFEHITEPLGMSQNRVRTVVKNSFAAWAQHTNIEFREAATENDAHILIGAITANTSISRASTGLQLGGPLADGNFVALKKAAICFDASAQWQDENFVSKDVLDVGATLKHEIGHALGFNHTYDKTAVMYSRYRYDPLSGHLAPSDIAGLHFVYGNTSPAIAFETPRNSL